MRWHSPCSNDKAFIILGEPKLDFSQLDFDLDDVVVPNSEWGWVAITYSGSPNVQYFNLVVDESWVIQNVPTIRTKAKEEGRLRRPSYTMRLPGCSAGVQVSMRPFPGGPRYLYQVFA